MADSTECRHESGPIAILDRYEKFLEGRLVPRNPTGFDYSREELQQPIRCCFKRLGEVFKWQLGERRHHLVMGREYPIPMFVQDSANSQAYIHLDSGIPEDVIDIPFGD